MCLGQVLGSPCLGLCASSISKMLLSVSHVKSVKGNNLSINITSCYGSTSLSRWFVLVFVGFCFGLGFLPDSLGGSQTRSVCSPACNRLDATSQTRRRPARSLQVKCVSVANLYTPGLFLPGKFC